LIGVQLVVLEERCPQRVDQWLQLGAALADPLGKRGARDRQAGALEDAFLPVER
jgi:hypothetical protein